MKIKIQKAFTIMEVLVAMAIFALAVLGISLMAQMGYQYYNFIFNQAEIVNSIQKSITEMSREIREMRQADSGAYNLEKADSGEIIFYSDIDDSPDVERIRYFIDGNCLKRGIIKTSGIPPRYLEEDEQLSNISCNVANNPTEPMFAYYSSYPGTGTILATPADPHLVKIVNIFLRIQSTGIAPVPMSKTISDYVRPRNVNREEDH